jgi:hypothetical protein
MPQDQMLHKILFLRTKFYTKFYASGPNFTQNPLYQDQILHKIPMPQDQILHKILCLRTKFYTKFYASGLNFTQNPMPQGQIHMREMIF